MIPFYTAVVGISRIITMLGHCSLPGGEVEMSETWSRARRQKDKPDVAGGQGIRLETPPRSKLVGQACSR